MFDPVAFFLNRSPGFSYLLAFGVFFILVLLFRRTLGKKSAPRGFLDPPSLSHDIASFIVRLDKWRAAGRITSAEYERLMRLCQEDRDDRTDNSPRAE